MQNGGVAVIPAWGTGFLTKQFAERNRNLLPDFQTLSVVVASSAEKGRFFLNYQHELASRI